MLNNIYKNKKTLVKLTDIESPLINIWIVITNNIVCSKQLYNEVDILTYFDAATVL